MTWKMSYAEGEILFEIIGKVVVSIDSDGVSYAVFNQEHGRWEPGKHNAASDFEAAGKEIEEAAGQ